MTDYPHLDAQIHAQVMGRVVYPQEAIDPTGLYRQAIPPYSSQVHSAWVVVEHLQAQGWWVSLAYKSGIFHDDYSRPGYEVRFRNVDLARIEAFESTDPNALDAYSWAEELPEAICRAALKVIR